MHGFVCSRLVVFTGFNPTIAFCCVISSIEHRSIVQKPCRGRAGTMILLDSVFKKLQPRFDDDSVDRLNYYYTPLVLVCYIV